MNDLPPRQSALFDFLVRYQDRHGYAPSLSEMRDGLGLSSINAVAELVTKLEARGCIRREPGTRRAIQILGETGRQRSQQLPLLGRIAAGAPITSGEHVAEYLDINPALFRPRADLLFRVKGLSMVNLGVRDGDLIGVHLQSEVSSGQVVAAVITHPRTGDAELTLKTYRKRGHQVSLLSENDDQTRYPPLVFDLRRDDVQIVGLYCGLVRSQVP